MRGVWLAALFGYAFFVPNLAGYVGSTGAILVNGGLLVLAGLAFTRESLRVRFMDRAERRLCMLIVASLAYYLVTICFSTGFLSRTIIVRDLFELHKPLLHAASFLLPFALIRSEDDAARLDRVLRVCVIGVIAIGLLQFFRVGFVGELYTKPLNIQSHRVAAPFGNPYDFGFAMSFFLYLLVFGWVRERRTSDAVLGAVLAGMILLTQSRTMAITIVGSLALTFPLVLAGANAGALRRLRVPSTVLRYALLGALALVAVVLVLRAYSEELRYLISGITALLVQGEQGSLTVRLQKLQTTADFASSSVLIALFGNGVSKGVMQFVESAPAFFLFRYGLIGFLVIFVAPLILMILFLSYVLVRPGRRHSSLQAATLVWLISLLVASIGNAFSEQPRVSFLYYFMMGFSIRHYYVMHVGARARHGAQLSLVSSVCALLRRRRLVASSALACVVAAVLIAPLRAERYTAESKILVQRATAGNTGAPLAFYATMLGSAEFRRQAARTRYRFPVSAGADTIEGRLVDLYDPAGRTATERVTSVIERLDDAILVETNDATQMITLETTAPWPALAEQINGRLVELLNTEIETRRRARVAAGYAFVEGQLQRVNDELRTAERDFGVFLARNRRIEGSPALQLEAQHLRRAIERGEAAYVSLAESSSGLESWADWDAPVLVPLDTPAGSARRQSRARPARMLLAMLLGGVLGTIWVFVRDPAGAS